MHAGKALFQSCLQQSAALGEIKKNKKYEGSAMRVVHFSLTLIGYTLGCR